MFANPPASLQPHDTRLFPLIHIQIAATKQIWEYVLETSVYFFPNYSSYFVKIPIILVWIIDVGV